MEKEVVPILIIEDDVDDLFFIKEVLTKSTLYKYEIETINSLKMFADVNSDKFQLAILDLNLTDSNAFETLDFIQSQDLNYPVIAISEEFSYRNNILCATNGIMDFISKKAFYSTDLDNRLGFIFQKAKQTAQIKKEKNEEIKYLTSQTAHHINNSLMVLSYINNSTPELPEEKQEKISNIIDRLKLHAINMMLISDQSISSPRSMNLNDFFNKLNFDCQQFQNAPHLLIDEEKFFLIFNEYKKYRSLADFLPRIDHEKLELIFHFKTDSPKQNHILEKSLTHLIQQHNGKVLFDKNTLSIVLPFLE